MSVQVGFVHIDSVSLAVLNCSVDKFECVATQRFWNVVGSYSLRWATQFKVTA